MNKGYDMTTFKYLVLTNLTEAQVLTLAKDFQKRAKKRGFVFDTQEAVDAVIEANMIRLHAE